MSDFLSPAINDVLKGDDMDTELKQGIVEVFESYGIDFPEYSPYEVADEILNIFLDTIEKAKPPYLRSTDQLGTDVVTQSLISDSKIVVFNHAVKHFSDNLLKEIKK